MTGKQHAESELRGDLELLNVESPAATLAAEDRDKRPGPPQNAARMVSFSVLPVSGPNTNPAIRKTLSSRRKVYPEPTATGLRGERGTGPQRRSRSRVTSKDFSSWVAVGMKVLVGFMAFTCFSWSVWLILLTVKPNDTVNWVMKTETFDNGSFWLMVDPSLVMNGFSVCGLSLVAVAYSSIIFKLLRRQNRVRKAARPCRLEWMKTNLREGIMAAPVGRRRSKAATLLNLTVLLLENDEAYYVKIARIGIKFADLAVESMILYLILEAGSPLALVTTFTVIIVINALSCAVLMFLPDDLTGLTEVVVDTVLDFFVVVVYPMLMVIYCLASFSLDHGKIAINLSVFPIGSFERNASVIADPVQTGIIYAALKSLQIFSFGDFCLRVGVHLVFSYRLGCVADLIQDPSRRPGRLYPKRHFVSAALLVVFAIILVILVHKSVSTSATVCLPHPECAVKAHRWTIVEHGSLTQCPCLALIDGDLAPKSFDSWLQPENVTAKVVQLASTGDLRTIQLTNRYFPDLPDELRRCRQMRHLSLVYTHTESLPAWIKDYVNLEYLYVEGTIQSSLLELPDGMFDNMKSLTFIHMGMHSRLREIPSFDGLRNLKALTLALFTSLVELPSFNSLHSLERFVMSYVPRIDTLPDLTSVQKLKAFSDPFCAGHPFWGIPPASCLPSTIAASNETKAVIKKFSSTVCRKEDTNPGPGFPSPDTIALCDGVLYRKCHLPGVEEAMCYNARFMAVFCMSDSFVIEMRRQQIQLGVGDRCNAEHESWLGCD